MFLRLLTRRRLEEIAKISSVLESQRSDLAQQLESTAIDADFEVGDEARAAFAELVREFKSLQSCDAIWDISESIGVDRARTRSAAAAAVARHRVSFTQASLDAIDSDFESLRFCNANGGDLFLFPCFLAVRKTDGYFALIDIRQLEMSISSTRFIEEENLPSDSERVGNAWARSNKDGSPDRRFANNYQIPVVRYGKFFLSSRTGLNEAYMVSNCGACENFGKAFEHYIATLPARVSGEAQSSEQLIDSLPTLEIPARPIVPRLLHSRAWAALMILVFVAGVGIAWWLGVPIIQSRPSSAPLAAQPAAFDTTAAASAPEDSASEQEIESAATTPREPDAANSDFADMTTPLTRHEIAVLQKKLSALGFDAGTSDGIIGRRTIAAVKSYQGRHGLLTTGAVDRALFDHVMRQANPH